MQRALRLFAQARTSKDSQSLVRPLLFIHETRSEAKQTPTLIFLVVGALSGLLIKTTCTDFRLLWVASICLVRFGCSFRSVRNLIIDLRHVPSEKEATGLHWQVAQATSLVNVVVEMSTASGTNHRGEENRNHFLG